MPGIGSFPCEGCDYVAPNRRMLARHVAIHHSEKVFKCPVCPFVTLYPANWYRHKRDIHGLSKETTCEICGFFTNSHEEIQRHKETEHRDHVKTKGHGREKKKHAVPSHSSTSGPHLIPGTTDVILPKFEENVSPSQEQDGTAEDSIQFSLPLNGSFMDDSPVLNSFEVPGEQHVSSDKGANNSPTTSGGPQSLSHLGPLKVKRSYSCPPCGLQTTNPREFLYHRRDVHHERITIHECKYCLYASRHIQKLHRHCGLVHRNQIGSLPPKTNKRATKKESAASSSSIKLTQTSSAAQDNVPVTGNSHSFLPKSENKHEFSSPSRSEIRNELISSKTESKTELFSSRTESKTELFTSRSESKPKPVLSRSENKTETFFPRSENKILQCSTCSFQTKNKILLLQHEKTIHFKKKFFCCVQCGYVTNDKARYGKHVKYHNIPKVKCDLCEFQTAYKWNMDRHMRNHMTGGDFRCDKCCFTANSKQSLTVHLINHHDGVMQNSGKDQGENDIYEYFDDEFIEQEWGEKNMDDMQFEEAMPDEFIQMEEMQMDTEDKKSFSQSWSPDAIWKRGKMYPKNLKCQHCPFRAAWPSELKKHEEGHQPPMKRHPCPLCGMRFEHLAWLTKHLMRVHKENTEAHNIAAVLQMVNPQRRKSVAKAKLGELETSSQQKTLLSKALKSLPTRIPLKQHDIPSPSKHSSTPIHTDSLQMQISSLSSQKMSSSNSAVTICEICGYRTRWISELQKHMRVHSDEKPFPCPKCNYRCKWKGDLTRHLTKYHSNKTPPTTKAASIPPLKLKLTKVQNSSNSSLCEWQGTPQEPSKGTEVSKSGSANIDQDIPLDLSVCKTLEFLPSSSTETMLNEVKQTSSDAITTETNEDDYVDIEESEMDETSNISSPSHTSLGSANKESKTGFSGNIKVKKFRCPFCTFMTRTASRFHVHIVQHYNKRPFMCSVCEYRSNWEWDINKHIRMKSSKDPSHANAFLVLTDETGRRNYEKYDKFLTEIEVDKESERTSPKSQEQLDVRSGNTTPDRQTNNSICATEENSHSSIISDEKATKEQNESPLEGAPESIVVTPDISFASEEPASQEQTPLSLQGNVDDKKNPNPNEMKLYRCTHCNYRNLEKKVVISHLAVHAGVKPFRCRICGMSSSWRHVIVRHVKVRHGGYMHDVENRITYAQQGYCIYLTSVDSNSKRTSTSSERNDVFCCKMCPYKCDKYFYMKFHMKHHRPREGATYKCLFCPYFVKFRKTLVRHMKLHSKDPEAILTKMSSAEADLNEMDSSSPLGNFDEDSMEDDNSNITINQEGEDMLSIDYDANSSLPDSRWQMENSILKEVLHMKMKRHACEHCPYKTDNKTQYLYHKQFHRPNKNAPFKCKKCSYWATLQHLLTQHMKVHWQHEEEMMQVEKYNAMPVTGSEVDDTYDWPEPSKNILKHGRYFSYKTESENKVLKKTSEHIPCVFVKRGDFLLRMFKCRFCPMTNKKRANVRLHERMHTKLSTTRFSCHLCNYKCLNQGSLTNHMKIHKGHRQKKPDTSSFTSLDGSSPLSPQFEDSGNGFSLYRKKVHSYFCMKCPAVFKSFPDLKLHKTFHGAHLPYPCHLCDYRARHKPHLHKHLQVHTPLYAEKRASSRAPPPFEQDGQTELVESEVSSSNNLSIVQMLLLEEAEVSAFIRSGSAQNSQKLHKCELCPAAFYKSTTLTYHLSLHGSIGKYPCSHCNYATNSSVNLATHIKLHIKPTVPVKPGRRIFFCPKCPASFNKQNRFECHIKLHGKKSRYTCDMCDYSVHYAANLFKHKAVHSRRVKPNSPQTTNAKKEQEDANIASMYHQSLAFQQQTTTVKSTSEIQKTPDTSDEKKIFICDRCPYNQARKDAVQSHQRRHSSKDGMKCPHCDYSSLQTSFLRDHTKWHLQPNPLFKIEAFMSCEQLEIWATEESEKEHLFFKDEGSENSSGARFYPPYENDYVPDVSGNTILENLYDDAETDTEMVSEIDLTILDQDKQHLGETELKLSLIDENTDNILSHEIHCKELEECSQSTLSSKEEKFVPKERDIGFAQESNILNEPKHVLNSSDNSDLKRQNQNDTNCLTSPPLQNTTREPPDEPHVNEVQEENCIEMQPAKIQLSIKNPHSLGSTASETRSESDHNKANLKNSIIGEKNYSCKQPSAPSQASNVKVLSPNKKDVLEECDAVSDDTLPAECEYQEEITSSAQDTSNGPVQKECESLSTELNENGNIIINIGSEYFATHKSEYIQEEEVQSSEIEVGTSETQIDDMDWKSGSKDNRNEMLADVTMSEVCSVTNSVDSKDTEGVLLSRNGTMPATDIGFVEEPNTVLDGCHAASVVSELETPLPEVEIHL